MRDESRWFFCAPESDSADFPLSVSIHWDQLHEARRVLLLQGAIAPFLFQREVLGLLARERDPDISLILDFMWSTGARISETEAMTRDSVMPAGEQYSVWLRPHRRRPGRPAHTSAPERRVLIDDRVLIERLRYHIQKGRLGPRDPVFRTTRQTVNRHLERLARREHNLPFRISTETVRRSYAVHLMLHGRPPQAVARLLGVTARAVIPLWRLLDMPDTVIVRGLNLHDTRETTERS